MSKPIIAITMGDPAGVGPEVCLRALNNPEIASLCTPALFGDATVLKRCAEKLGFNARFAELAPEEKRARQSIKRRAQNMAARSRLRSSIKRASNSVEEGNKDEAAAHLKAAVPVIDAMVSKGIIHRNKAARHKSRLNARIKALAQ
jgi:small subunit ribosomal protein S20